MASPYERINVALDMAGRNRTNLGFKPPRLSQGLPRIQLPAGRFSTGSSDSGTDRFANLYQPVGGGVSVDAETNEGPGGILGGVMSVLDFGRSAVVSTIKETIDTVQGAARGEFDVSPGDWYQQATNHYGFGDLIHDERYSVGLGLIALAPFTYGASAALGAAVLADNYYADVAIGFMGDVALDPLTYMGGTNIIARGLGGYKKAGLALNSARKMNNAQLAKMAVDMGTPLGKGAGVRMRAAIDEAMRVGAKQRTLSSMGRSLRMTEEGQVVARAMGLDAGMRLRMPGTGAVGSAVGGMMSRTPAGRLATRMFPEDNFLGNLMDAQRARNVPKFYKRGYSDKELASAIKTMRGNRKAAERFVASKPELARVAGRAAKGHVEFRVPAGFKKGAQVAFGATAFGRADLPLSIWRAVPVAGKMSGVRGAQMGKELFRKIRESDATGLQRIIDRDNWYKLDADAQEKVIGGLTGWYRTHMSYLESVDLKGLLRSGDPDQIATAWKMDSAMRSARGKKQLLAAMARRGTTAQARKQRTHVTRRGGDFAKVAGARLDAPQIYALNEAAVTGDLFILDELGSVVGINRAGVWFKNLPPAVQQLDDATLIDVAQDAARMFDDLTAQTIKAHGTKMPDGTYEWDRGLELMADEGGWIPRRLTESMRELLGYGDTEWDEAVDIAGYLTAQSLRSRVFKVGEWIPLKDDALRRAEKSGHVYVDKLQGDAKFLATDSTGSTPFTLRRPATVGKSVRSQLDDIANVAFGEPMFEDDFFKVMKSWEGGMSRDIAVTTMGNEMRRAGIDLMNVDEDLFQRLVTATDHGWDSTVLGRKAQATASRVRDFALGAKASSDARYQDIVSDLQKPSEYSQAAGMGRRGVVGADQPVGGVARRDRQITFRVPSEDDIIEGTATAFERDVLLEANRIIRWHPDFAGDATALTIRGGRKQALANEIADYLGSPDWLDEDFQAIGQIIDDAMHKLPRYSSLREQVDQGIETVGRLQRIHGQTIDAAGETEQMMNELSVLGVRLAEIASDAEDQILAGTFKVPQELNALIRRANDMAARLGEIERDVFGILAPLYKSSIDDAVSAIEVGAAREFPPVNAADVPNSIPGRSDVHARKDLGGLTISDTKNATVDTVVDSINTGRVTDDTRRLRTLMGVTPDATEDDALRLQFHLWNRLAGDIENARYPNRTNLGHLEAYLREIGHSEEHVAKVMSWIESQFDLILGSTNRKEVLDAMENLGFTISATDMIPLIDNSSDWAQFTTRFIDGLIQDRIVVPGVGPILETDKARFVLRGVRKQLYDQSQALLKDFPDQITIYRYSADPQVWDDPSLAASAAARGEVGRNPQPSYTINPAYKFRDALNSWWRGHRDVGGGFDAYTVKKSDIDFVMDTRSGVRHEYGTPLQAEAEVLINPKKLGFVEGSNPRNQRLSDLTVLRQAFDETLAQVRQQVTYMRGTVGELADFRQGMTTGDFNPGQLPLIVERAKLIAASDKSIPELLELAKTLDADSYNRMVAEYMASTGGRVRHFLPDQLLGSQQATLPVHATTPEAYDLARQQDTQISNWKRHVEDWRAGDTVVDHEAFIAPGVERQIEPQEVDGILNEIDRSMNLLEVEARTTQLLEEAGVLPRPQRKTVVTLGLSSADESEILGAVQIAADDARTLFAEAQVVRQRAQAARQAADEALPGMEGSLVRDAGTLEEMAFAAELEAQAAAREASEILAASKLSRGATGILADEFVGVPKTPAEVEAWRDMMLDGTKGWGPWKMASGNAELDEGVLAAMSAFQKMNSPRDINKWLRGYDKMLNWMKAGMIATPGFVERNVFGAMFNAWLDGIPPTAIIRSANLTASFGSQTQAENQTFMNVVRQAVASGKGRTVNGVKYGPDELQNYLTLIEQGVRGGGMVTRHVRVPAAGLREAAADNLWVGTKQAAETITRPVAFWKSNFWYYNMVRSANMQAEDVIRLGIGVEAMRWGATADEALERIARSQFDYSELTTWERNVAQRVIPFYTWTRKNLPYQMQKFATQPASYNRLLAAKRNLELGSEEEGVVPDWFVQPFGIRLPWKYSGGTVYTVPDLPFQDLFRFDPTGPEGLKGVWDQFMWQVSPVAKVPIETLFKTKASGIPFRGDYIPTPRVFEDIPFLMDAAAAVGYARKDEGEWQMRDHHVYFLTNMIPMLGRVRRILPNEERYQQRLWESVMSTFLGINARVQTPEAEEGWLRHLQWEENKRRADAGIKAPSRSSLESYDPRPDYAPGQRYG